jgi:hypothetical protein
MEDGAMDSSEWGMAGGVYELGASALHPLHSSHLLSFNFATFLSITCVLSDTSHPISPTAFLLSLCSSASLPTMTRRRVWHLIATPSLH